MKWDRIPTDLTFSQLRYRAIRYSGQKGSVDRRSDRLEISWSIGVYSGQFMENPALTWMLLLGLDVRES